MVGDGIASAGTSLRHRGVHLTGQFRDGRRRVKIKGVFRFTRNPMYLGMFLMLAGAAFFMGTIPALLAPAAFFLIMDKFFIPLEEEKLLNGFGAEYSDYMEKTRR